MPPIAERLACQVYHRDLDVALRFKRGAGVLGLARHYMANSYNHLPKLRLSCCPYRTVSIRAVPLDRMSTLNKVLCTWRAVDAGKVLEIAVPEIGERGKCRAELLALLILVRDRPIFE